MPRALYSSSVPVIVRFLNNLSGILKKAEIYSTSKKIEPGVLINARLAPDMFPLSRQIQIACDVAKGGAARLAGAEIPSFPDTETTFEQLQERIAKTIKFVQGIPEKQFEGSETRDIAFKVGGNDLKFVGTDYLNNFVLPNVFFHITTTYAILRHNGLDIGKGDFLGSLT